ncbi:cytochrome P450 [Streptomyces sp. NPDC088752]|uniref:cytochrome P450 n=1 Tax=Streptomyces sp. NPDC088752 TaxID=3154963 RepID=UPI00343D1866
MVFDGAILMSRETALNPYPAFAAMRAAEPVHWNEPSNSWYVTPYRLVSELLREPSLSARPGDYTGQQRTEDMADVEEAVAFFNSWMLFSDPPRQTRLRDVVAPAFPRRKAEAWAQYARTAAREVLREAERDMVWTCRRRGEIDLFGDFAAPLATRLTCAVLGVPAQDTELVQGWASQLMDFLKTPTAEAHRARAALDAVGELRSYLARTVVPRLSSTQDDRLVALRGISRLDPHEALALFSQLLTGGVDPVASALATTAHIVMTWEHDRLAATLAESGRLEEVVEEALRYDAPFHLVPRTTTTDLNIADRLVPAGERLVLVVAAANRDETVYQDPELFLPGRPGPPHLSFGLGKHYCLAAALARVVLREGLRELIRWLVHARPQTLESARAPSFGATTWERILVAV